jgi:uncharacterized membrane protein YtjA (UPF0391 family)
LIVALIGGAFRTKKGVAMWCYATALFAIVVTAEAVGLGGIPAEGMEIENSLFILLVAAFVVMAFKQIMRR